MKNFEFQIADRSPLQKTPVSEVDLTHDYFDFMGDDEGDAYALEDLLRLVQMGDDTCLDRQNVPFLSDEDALIWALAYLTETPLGRAMAFDARFEDWALEVDDLESGQPSIDSQLRILILPRGTPSLHVLSGTQHYRNQFLMNLARGLRMIWQDMNGVRARQDISIDDQILLERLRRADQDVVMLRMAWDLRDSDGGALWRQLIADDIGNLVTMAAGLWSDDGAELEPLPTSLLQVFQLWLASDELLSHIDSVTLDEIDGRLQRGISEICGTRLLQPDDILSLGRLPDGGSYLAPLTRSILYAEDLRRIPDQMLEAHLRQIIEDCGFVFAAPLVFNDPELQEKIFPSQRLDTLA